MEGGVFSYHAGGIRLSRSELSKGITDAVELPHLFLKLQNRLLLVIELRLGYLGLLRLHHADLDLPLPGPLPEAVVVVADAALAALRQDPPEDDLAVVDVEHHVVLGPELQDVRDLLDQRYALGTVQSD